MKTLAQIEALLDELEHRVADDLEDQELDFKQWDAKSRDKAVRTVVQMAVCMANGGGGAVVFGVADRILGRAKAVLGVPSEIDANILKKAVYDQTDPKITPDFAQIAVPEGTGRLLVMRIHPGMPPYTDSAGRGTVRVGKDCLPLTGTLRRKIGVETGATDYTAESVALMDVRLLSATALEALRDQARREKAPDDLLGLSDAEFLASLGLIRRNKLTRAALLLAGTEAAIREHLPGHGWTFLRMTGDADYDIREDQTCALPLSVRRIEELLAPFNPITTLRQGMFHYEYRTWPEIAVREALMNAFCHADLRMAGPIMVRLYSHRLEIGNNGGFIGGITPENILHRPPVARNPLLVEALTRLRLVNRSNLGIGRMFAALLAEGKDAPVIREIGDSVLVSFAARDLNAAFRLFVGEEGGRGRALGIDELLLLRHLSRHPVMDTVAAAALCQRGEAEVRETLSAMTAVGYLEQGGQGQGTRWSLHPRLRDRLLAGGSETSGRPDWEAAKAQLLDTLKERARRNEPGLTNQEIRQMTGLDRRQVVRLMTELRREHPEIHAPGRGKYARYGFTNGTSNGSAHENAH